MKNEWKNYTDSIISNNQYFSQKLQELWANIIWYPEVITNNHQLFWYFPEHNNIEIYEILWKVGVFVNLLPMPFCDTHILGFRSWVQELSFLWWEKPHIDSIISIISQIYWGEYDLIKCQEEVRRVKTELLSNFHKKYDTLW